MPLPETIINTVCKPGKGGQTCSYLTFGEGFQCAKAIGLGGLIAQRRATGTIRALADSCAGPDANFARLVCDNCHTSVATDGPIQLGEICGCGTGAYRLAPT